MPLSKIRHLLLAFVVKKAEYDAPDLENCMPKSLIDKEKRVGISLPLNDKLTIAIISRSVGLIVAIKKMKPWMEVALNPKKLNIRVVLIRISCYKSVIRS